jgi:two-component system, response regulator YesN
MFQDEVVTKDVNSDEQIDLIVESIKRCDEEGFVCHFNALIEDCKSMEYQSIINTLVNLCQNIYAILHNIDINSVTMNQLSVTDIIKTVKNKDELYYFFQSLYKEVETILNNINNNKTINSLKSAAEYITSNYQDTSLTASMVAEKISITPQHFSKLFKRFIGISFPDYLNDIRLSEAKKSIDRNPSLEMQEVSSIVGYSNSSYFSKSFKEKYGITPTGYRQRLMEKNADHNIIAREEI